MTGIGRTDAITLKLPKVLHLASILLFVSCLRFATTSPGPVVTWEGLQDLLLGWLAPFGTLTNFSWFASPALIASWVLFSDRRPSALIWSGLAAIIVLLPLFSNSVVDNETGSAFPLRALRLGFWLWVGSVQTQLLACVTFVMTARSDEELPSEPNR